VVEGTPLLREHLVKNWIQGSNPCVSASNLKTRTATSFAGFSFLAVDLRVGAKENGNLDGT
jgi:hypothetical protein